MLYRILMAAVLLAAPFSYGQEANVIAVSELVNCSGISKGDMDTITQRIRLSFAQSKDFIIIDKKLMTDILHAQNVSSCPACSTMECLTGLGKLLTAKTMIGGSIGRKENKVTVHLLMIDAEKKRIINRVSREVTATKAALLNTYIPQTLAALLSQPSQKGKQTIAESSPPSSLPEDTKNNKKRRSIMASPLSWVGISAVLISGGFLAWSHHSDKGKTPGSTNSDISINDAPTRTP